MRSKSFLEALSQPWRLSGGRGGKEKGRSLFLAAICAALVSCGGGSAPEDSGFTQDPGSLVSPDPLADALFGLQLIDEETEKSSESSGRRLFSELWQQIDNGDGDAARQILHELEQSEEVRDGMEETELRLAKAWMLAEVNPRLARQRLRESGSWDGWPNALVQRAISLGLVTSRALGDHQGIVEYLGVLVERFAEGERARGQQRIWNLLLSLPETKRRDLRQQAEPGTDFAGWLELVDEFGAVSDVRLQYQAYLSWRQRWPNHPAAQIPPLSLAGLAQLQQWGRIAVLLPLSGPLANAGKVVRDGMVDAYLRKPQGRVRLVFIDTEGKSTAQSYRQALAEGADMVIGPLEKNRLPELLELLEEDSSIVGLNYLPEEVPAPGGFWQLGLRPEDDIEQITRCALASGFRRAAVLYENADWALRSRERFHQLWVEAGGVVVVAAELAALDKVGETVEDALLINESRRRLQQLRRTLGKRVDQTDRRRQDIDSVFLLAGSRFAGSVKPALDYNFLGDIPVFSTHHVVADNSGDAQGDLAGIYHSDLPWRLQTDESARNLELSLPSSRGPFFSLYALGADALAVASRLGAYEDIPDFVFQGQTGRIYHAGNGRLQRLPGLARISEDGYTAPLPYSGGDCRLPQAPPET